MRHDFAKCKYKRYKCKKCGKIWHLAKVCLSNDDCKQNNVVEESYFDFEDVSNVENRLDKVKDPAIIIDVKINNKVIPIEVNMGARITVMPLDVFKKHFTNIQLKSSTRILRFYDNSTVIPVNEFDAKVSFKTKTNECSIVVVKENRRTTLMGRNLFFFNTRMK